MHYVSITEGFNGGRFCEPGFSYNDQWYNDDVLLWNLNLWASTQNVTDEGTISAADQGTPVNTTTNTTQLQPPAGVNDTLVPGNLTAWSGALGCGGGNDVDKGWCRRPFHPKSKGHTAIKNSIIAALQADKFPSVAPPQTAVPQTTLPAAASSTTVPAAPFTTSAPAAASTTPVTCPSSSNLDCDGCPTGYDNCSPIGTTGLEAVCNCADPCGSVVCSYDAV